MFSIRDIASNSQSSECGVCAGRFAEVALEAGGKVVALDYSSAVDACDANLKHHPNLRALKNSLDFLFYNFHQFFRKGAAKPTKVTLKI